MDSYIMKSVKRFEDALTGIFEDAIIDIVLHGSTVDGGFVEGKGDIDFLVILDRKSTEEEFEKVKNYHRQIRKTGELERQFEGCYLSLNKEKTAIESGLYIGTGEKGWKRFEGNIFSQMDMAHILENNYSFKDKNIINNIFSFHGDEVEDELKQQIITNLNSIDKYDDYEFKLHVLHTSARSLYTLKYRKFISKRQSLEWLENNPDFSKNKEFIGFIKKYKSPLTIDEKDEISKIGLDSLKELLEDILENIK